MECSQRLHSRADALLDLHGLGILGGKSASPSNKNKDMHLHPLRDNNQAMTLSTFLFRQTNSKYARLSFYNSRYLALHLERHLLHTDHTLLVVHR